MEQTTYATPTRSASLPKIDLALGALGEDYIIRNAFVLFKSQVKEDRRDNHLEGELLLEDGRLVEVKSDFTGYPDTNGTVVVEIENPKNALNEGWYQCCKRNHVDLIAWTCYHKNKYNVPRKLPYAIFVVPFPEIVEFIDDYGEYFETNNQRLVSLSIHQLLRYCGERATLFRMAYPSDDITVETIHLWRNQLQELLPPGLVLAETPSQLLFKDRRYVGEEDNDK